MCSDRQTLKRQILHAKKLKDIRGRKKGTGTLDNTAPETTRMKHLQINLKKEQLLEERFSEIERENGILLGKIVHIETHSVMGEKFANPNPSRGDAVKGHSLNEAMRKRELMRIGAENEALLRRIMSRKPNYNHSEWEDERKQSEQYLKALSKVFPKPEFEKSSLMPHAPAHRYIDAGNPQARGGSHRSPPAGAILQPLNESESGTMPKKSKKKKTKDKNSSEELVFEKGRKIKIYSSDGSDTEKSISLSLDVFSQSGGSMQVTAKSIKKKDAFSPLQLSADDINELLPDCSALSPADLGKQIVIKLEVRQIDGANMLVLPAVKKIHLGRMGKKCGHVSDSDANRADNYAVFVATKYSMGLFKINATETSGASQNKLVSVQEAERLTGYRDTTDNHTMEGLAKALLLKASFEVKQGRNVLIFQ